MPELPEVETARAQVEQFCCGSTILQCNALEQGGGPVSQDTHNIGTLSHNVYYAPELSTFDDHS